MRVDPLKTHSWLFLIERGYRVRWIRCLLCRNTPNNWVLWFRILAADMSVHGTSVGRRDIANRLLRAGSCSY